MRCKRGNYDYETGKCKHPAEYIKSQCEDFPNCDYKVYIPRIIGARRVIKGTKGQCTGDYGCKELFPLEEMCLIATGFREQIFGYDLYCQECFNEMSEGDSKAWREAL